jgi:hypothetical protein
MSRHLSKWGRQGLRKAPELAVPPQKGDRTSPDLSHYSQVRLGRVCRSPESWAGTGFREAAGHQGTGQAALRQPLKITC